jgi:bacterioferritin-associated ferredoxin
MIVCSCNVFSDQQIRSALAKATQRQRMSQIYQCLGGSAQCGRCAHTIKRIMEQVASRAFVCVSSSTNLHTRTQERQSPADKISHPRVPIRQVNRSVSART